MLQHVFVILFRYDTRDIIDIADLVFVQLYFQVCRAGIQDNPGHERMRSAVLLRPECFG